MWTFGELHNLFALSLPSQSSCAQLCHVRHCIATWIARASMQHAEHLQVCCLQAVAKPMLTFLKIWSWSCKMQMQASRAKDHWVQEMSPAMVLFRRVSCLRERSTVPVGMIRTAVLHYRMPLVLDSCLCKVESRFAWMAYSWFETLCTDTYWPVLYRGKQI